MSDDDDEFGLTDRDRRIMARYSELHRKYLADRHPEMYESLRKSGELDAHCEERGEEAFEMYERVAYRLEQAAREKYFETDTIRLIKELEQIPHIAGEVVLNDLVWSL